MIVLGAFDLGGCVVRLRCWWLRGLAGAASRAGWVDLGWGEPLGRGALAGLLARSNELVPVERSCRAALPSRGDAS